MNRFILLLVILAFTLPVSAQDKDSTMNDIYSLDLEELLNLKVTTVSKMQESSLTAPQTNIIITAEDIKNYGYTDIEQVFHDLPGFDITRGVGTEYSQIYQRGYRSNNTDRTLLLIDGVEQNDLWSNSAWISRQLPLSNIKQIEIIYGPSSTIYGANAFVGVVNIITKKPNEYIKLDKKIGGSAQIGYGTWNTKYADFIVAAAADNVTFDLSGRIFLSNEMDISQYPDWDYDLKNYDLAFYKNTLNTNSDTIATIAKALDNQHYFNDKNLNGILPKYSNKTEDYYLKGRLIFNEFTFGMEWWKINEGYGGWYTDNYELGTDHDGKWVPMHTNIFAKYEKNVSSKLNLTCFTRFKIHELTDDCKELYYIGYLNGSLGLNDLTDSSGNISAEPQQPYWYVSWYHSHSQQLRSELKANYKASKKLRFLSGLEYRSSIVQGLYLVSEEKNPSETAPPPQINGGNHFSSQDIGFYAQINYNIIPYLQSVVGGRIDHNWVRATGGYGIVANPKAALVYTPKKFIFKFIYSEAFKDADNWSKYSTTPGRLLSNPDLKPEKVKNTEIVSSWQYTKNQFIEFTFFDARYSNQIGTAQVVYVDQDENQTITTQHQSMGSLHIQGVQAQFKIKTQIINAYTNYTYTYPYNTSNNNRIRIGDIASNQINAGIYLKAIKNLGIGLRANYVGEKPTGKNTTISENPYRKIGSYLIFHSTLNYSIYKGLSLQITGRNILDTEYFHPGVRNANGDYYAARIPQNRRNIMAKILYSF